MLINTANVSMQTREKSFKEVNFANVAITGIFPVQMQTRDLCLDAVCRTNIMFTDR